MPQLRPFAFRFLASALSVYALIACTACGATPTTGHGHKRSSVPAFTAVGSTTTPTGTEPESQTGCAQTVASTLGEIAGRIYREASNGSNVEESVHRLRGSSKLAAAVSAGDASATRSALTSLLAGQIARVEVLRAGKRLAAAGSGPAIAPVTGSLPGSGGARFVLSVQSDRTYLQVTRQVTGAQVLLLGADGRRIAGTTSLPTSSDVPANGPVTVGSHTFEVASLDATAYPAGALRVAVLVPTTTISCPADAGQTRATVLGRVGERIYEEEQGSAYVKATVRRMEATSAFVEAAARRNVTATRAAIVGFFGAHIHVVRVRVTLPDGKLLYDLGGPHVLAPVSGTLRQGGKIVGHFLMAIQDDAGYLKLARLFTGAQVLMRTGAKQVAGTLAPGPAGVPDRGTVAYRGHTYQAYSFTGTAFPSGQLRISLLF